MDEISTPKEEWAYGRCVDAYGCVLGEWSTFQPFGPSLILPVLPSTESLLFIDGRAL